MLPVLQDMSRRQGSVPLACIFPACPHLQECLESPVHWQVSKGPGGCVPQSTAAEQGLALVIVCKHPPEQTMKHTSVIVSAGRNLCLLLKLLGC
jgi:hypothetical protein